MQAVPLHGLVGHPLIGQVFIRLRNCRANSDYQTVIWLTMTMTMILFTLLQRIAEQNCVNPKLVTSEHGGRTVQRCNVPVVKVVV